MNPRMKYLLKQHAILKTIDVNPKLEQYRPGIYRGLGPLGHNMVGRLANHLEAGADKIPPQLAATVMHPHRIKRGEASGC